MPITKERVYDLIDAATQIENQYLQMCKSINYLTTAMLSKGIQADELAQIHAATMYAVAPIAEAMQVLSREKIWRQMTHSRNEITKRRLERKRRENNVPVQRWGQAAREHGQELYKQAQAAKALEGMQESQRQKAISYLSIDSLAHLTREECPPERLAEWDALEAKAKTHWENYQSQQNNEEFDAPRIKGLIGINNQHVIQSHYGDLQGKIIICECGGAFGTIEEWTQHIKDAGAWSNEQITRPINVPESVRFPEDDPTFAILGGIIGDEPKSDSPTDEDKS